MSITVKFVHVHLVGKDVPFAKRGKFGVVHGAIESLFDVSHTHTCCCTYIHVLHTCLGSNMYNYTCTMYNTHGNTCVTACV